MVVVILCLLVYMINLQATKLDSIPLSTVKNSFAQENNSVLQSSQEQGSSNSSLLNTLNQTLSELENVNVTSRSRAVYNQRDGTLDNQTMLATNGITCTSANGTTEDILLNAPQ